MVQCNRWKRATSARWLGCRYESITTTGTGSPLIDIIAEEVCRASFLPSSRSWFRGEEVILRQCVEHPRCYVRQADRHEKFLNDIALILDSNTLHHVRHWQGKWKEAKLEFATMHVRGRHGRPFLYALSERQCSRRQNHRLTPPLRFARGHVLGRALDGHREVHDGAVPDRHPASAGSLERLISTDEELFQIPRSRSGLTARLGSPSSSCCVPCCVSGSGEAIRSRRVLLMVESEAGQGASVKGVSFHR